VSDGAWRAALSESGDLWTKFHRKEWSRACRLDEEKLTSGGTLSTQSTLTQKSPLQKEEGSPENTHYGGLKLNISVSHVGIWDYSLVWR